MIATMDMSPTVTDTLRLLAARPRTITYRRIATDTGLGIDWLAKFAVGAIREPGASKLERLRAYLLNPPPQARPTVHV